MTKRDNVEIIYNIFCMDVYVVGIHYANMSVQYTAIFHGCNNDNFQLKIFYISFFVVDQSIDCWHTLEPPHF